MLSELRITNFAHIGELSISFHPQFNIITGETGAGKSMVIDAIDLLAGGKADTSRVKQGSEFAEVEGLFVRGDGGECVLMRRIGADGKGRAQIDGALATVKQLSVLGSELLEFHGQHGQLALLHRKEQLAAIDRFGGEALAARKAAYRLALGALKKKHDELEALKSICAEKAGREDFLRWRLRELDNVGLKSGEDKDLAEKIGRLKRSAELFGIAMDAHQSVGGAPLEAVQSAAKHVGAAASGDAALESLGELLERSAADLEEAARMLREYSEGLRADADRLDDFQSRLFLLRDLMKKYDTDTDGLIDLIERDGEELARLESSESDLNNLERDVAKLAGEVEAAAAEMSALRSAAAETFSARVAEQLRDLALKDARFSIEFKPLIPASGRLGEDGSETAEFLFSAGGGEPLLPLARAASGGELARVMLAVKTVLGRAAGTATMVFDEIDSGVGGQTAVRVGERLAALAHGSQVVCVTHLPQIAAFADCHVSIRKDWKEGRAIARAEILQGEERLGELARLGGSLNESSISVENARRLIDQAQERKATVNS